MKKILFLSLSSLLLLSACGQSEKSDEKNVKSETKTSQTKNVKKDDKVVKVDGVTLKEPQKDTKCAACNMKVYQKSDALGKFSAQAVGEDGKNYFFDDLYCLLNYERKSKVKLKEKFVRDYKTLEWINVKDAKFVNGKIKTPMNVGYASFKDNKDAQAFAHEQHSHVDDLKIADKKALERFMKKQQMQEQGKDMKHDMKHDDAMKHQ